MDGAAAHHGLGQRLEWGNQDRTPPTFYLKLFLFCFVLFSGYIPRAGSILGDLCRDMVIAHIFLLAHLGY